MPKDSGKKEQRVAKARINTLFEQIDRMEPFNQKLADKYIHLAWNLSTHNKIHLPLAQKRSICRKCLSYWRPGRSVRIRIHQGKKIYTCLVCGAIKRVPYK